MNPQVLVALAEIVIALAVTLTLIALIVTIRQNTRSQKALAVDSLAAAITSINVPAMESPALGAAISKATTDWVIRRSGLDGRQCSENIITSRECVGYGGRGARTRIRQNFKSSFQEQNRRTSLAA